MNIFLDEHKQLIKDLIRNGVSFILIGGYAVNFHGYNRTTGDLDVWLNPDNQNKRNFILALRAFGIDEESLENVEKLDFTQTLAFSVGEPPYKVDFLTKIVGVNYVDADNEKALLSYEEMVVPFLNLRHLVLSKMVSGRTKDKLDVEMLQQIMRESNKTD